MILRRQRRALVDWGVVVRGVLVGLAVIGLLGAVAAALG